MEIEELNQIYEFHAFNEEYFLRAIIELSSNGQVISAKAIETLFEKYNKLLEEKENIVSEVDENKNISFEEIVSNR